MQPDLTDIIPLLQEKIRSGEAFEKFRALVAAQSGDVGMVDHPELLPSAPVQERLTAAQSGFISRIDAREVGLTALDLGAGRHKKGDPVDTRVGLVVHTKVGDRVEASQVLADIHARTHDDADVARIRLQRAFEITREQGQPLPLFYDTLLGSL